MQFYSLTFLYFFLPGALLAYNLTPKAYKNWTLMAVSVLFFALAQPEHFLLFAASVAAQFVFSEAMRKSEEKTKTKKAIFTVAVAVNAAVMIAFSVRNQLTGAEIPLGTMVVAFTAIGYFVDVYKGETEYIRSFADFSVFLGFFGKLYRGPLVRAGRVKESPNRNGFSLETTGEGIYLFVRGLAKLVLLAQPLEKMYENLCDANLDRISVVGAWLSVITLGMMIFHDLSGFCDMARGLGLCFGMDLPKNFYFPFQSPSVTDFLDRFNMTVTAFFRHYVYDSLRTDEKSKLQLVVDTLLICMLCGVWFGIRMNYVLWGLYIAAFIIIEKLFLNKLLERIPRFFTRIYTFCVTMFSMTIFSVDADIGIIRTFKAMFGMGAEGITDRVSYIVSENMLVLAVSAFFLTSIFSMLVGFINKKSKPAYSVFAVLETALLLVFITGELP